MSFSRFLLHKRGFHFNDGGFVKSTRWCSSSSMIGGEKKKPAHLDEPASDLTAFPNRDAEVEIGSGNKKKSLWCSFEGVLCTLREMVLGNRHGKNKLREKTDSPIFARFSEALLDEVSLDKSKEAEVYTNDVKRSDECLEARLYSEEEGKYIPGNISSRIGKRKDYLEVVKSENGLSSSEWARKKVEKEVSDQNKNAPKVVNFEIDSLACLIDTVLSEQSRTVLEETPETGPSKPENTIRVKDTKFDKNKDSDDESFTYLKSEALNDPHGAFLGKNKRKVLSLGNEEYELDNNTFDFFQGTKVKNSNMSIVLGELELEDNRFKEINRDNIDVVVKGMETKSLPTENSKKAIKPIADGGGEDMFGIKSLMSFINDLPKDFKSHVAVQSPVGLQHSVVKKTESSFEDDFIGHKSKKLHSRKEKRPVGTQSDTAHDQEKTADLGNQNNVEKTLYAFSTGYLAANTVLVRFLRRTIHKEDIYLAFRPCGRITDVTEVDYTAGCKFKDALVTLEKRKAIKKALQITGFRVRKQNAVVEAISVEDMPDRIPVPDLIGDPDVPIALVKNPTRTVKIRPLTGDMSLSQVKEALGFCGGSISGFFLGSSSSDAFVEFETEVAKERALAEHSISILGNRLRISRIDAPRTTVLRISNLSSYNKQNVTSICESYGKLEKVVVRCPERIVDAHFKLSEWPKMLNILNRLNGKMVDGKKWIVAPSPVFAPAILHILWNNPEEKKQLMTLVRDLSREFEGFVGSEERGIFSKVLKRMTRVSAAQTPTKYLDH